MHYLHRRPIDNDEKQHVAYGAHSAVHGFATQCCRSPASHVSVHINTICVLKPMSLRVRDAWTPLSLKCCPAFATQMAASPVSPVLDPHGVFYRPLMSGVKRPITCSSAPRLSTISSQRRVQKTSSQLGKEHLQCFQVETQRNSMSSLLAAPGVEHDK